jgi:hypothetical protein
MNVGRSMKRSTARAAGCPLSVDRGPLEEATDATLWSPATATYPILLTTDNGTEIPNLQSHIRNGFDHLSDPSCPLRVPMQGRGPLPTHEPLRSRLPHAARVHWCTNAGKLLEKLPISATFRDARRAVQAANLAAHIVSTSADRTWCARVGHSQNLVA